MPELEAAGSVFEGSIDRAIARARNESKLEGKQEALNRLALKKFGAAGRCELSALVAGIHGGSQLDDALDYLLECDDPGQCASFLPRFSNGS